MHVCFTVSASLRRCVKQALTLATARSCGYWPIPTPKSTRSTWAIIHAAGQWLTIWKIDSRVGSPSRSETQLKHCQYSCEKTRTSSVTSSASMADIRSRWRHRILLTFITWLIVRTGWCTTITRTNTALAPAGSNLSGAEWWPSIFDVNISQECTGLRSDSTF